MFDKFITKTKHNAADTLGMDVVLKHGSDYGTTGRVVYGSLDGKLYKDADHTIPVYQDEVVNAFVSGDLFVCSNSYYYGDLLSKAFQCTKNGEIVCFDDSNYWDSQCFEYGCLFTTYKGHLPPVTAALLNGTWRFNGWPDLSTLNGSWDFATSAEFASSDKPGIFISNIYSDGGGTLYATDDSGQDPYPGFTDGSEWTFNIDESKVTNYNELYQWLTANATKID